MRELFRFIHRFHLFLVFLILEIISISFLVNKNNYHRSKYYSSSNYVVGSIYETYNNITDFISLRKQNESLIQENEYLRNFRFNNNSYQTSESSFTSRYNYISANVINNSVYRKDNYMTLNIGRSSGVEPEMAVISSEGVIGITRFVSENFSTVITILNERLKVSTKINRNGFYGSLAWSGGDYTIAQLNEIPVHVDIYKGDTLTTSGYSAIFPDDICIGVIEDFSKIPGDNFYDITVKLIVDFKMLSNVYIIRNLLQEEQYKLEDKTIND